MSVVARLPVFARVYSLKPGDVWALTLGDFMNFCADHTAYIKHLQEPPAWMKKRR